MYSDTVRLPKTPFELRANSVKREPEIQAFWEEEGVYERISSREGAEPFTLHDGPPYANGDLHIGHALNKILKDFINRYQALQGKRVRYVPGWDTHGLPIELKVLQSLKKDERAALTPVTLREKAKAFALETVDKQRDQFMRYGLLGDWSDPYLTLKPEYEAAQVGVFGRMVLNGHIYRGLKPVNWSPSSQTALAEAELEYPEGHVSRSIYAAFKLEAASDALSGALPAGASASDVGVAVWTTTPWTIPANLAVAVNERLEYVLVEADGAAAAAAEDEAGAPLPWPTKYLLVAEGLKDALAAKLGVGLRTVASLKGKDIEGSSYVHPLAGRTSPVVIGGEYITTESGTGLVHTAPGHGAEDYVTGQKYGLPLLSPVDDRGRFTAEAGEGLEGLPVLDKGNEEIVQRMVAAGALLKEEPYNHKYPYDWRTKKPTIFRATEQWFASVEGFRESALSAIRGVQWFPASGEKRITSMTEGRSDWCISRQRTWGVPIPVFYDTESGEPLLNEETLEHIEGVFREHGSDAWWSMSIEELLPEAHRHLAPGLRKGMDTMDVWFDSGSSWAAVVQAREGLEFPANLYLEGSDQHRGWFQSSLLTAVASEGRAPYERVLTHGFVLDEKGTKMSKSLGNVVDPRLVINGGNNQKQEPPYGADVLRLWVASVDYSTDVLIGKGILAQVADVYRKLRGTMRFMLGTLDDYDPEVHAVPHAELPSLDKFMLAKLDALVREVEGAYDQYQFFRAYQALNQFAVVELSNFYFDMGKDRLYISAADDFRRRSCQTVLAATVRAYVRMLAPLTPHMAEDAFQAIPWEEAGGAQSVFEAGFAATEAEWAAGAGDEGNALWNSVAALRDEVNKLMESARGEKVIGASLEARVCLHATDAAGAARLAAACAEEGEGNGVDELRYALLVSGVEMCADADAVRAECPAFVAEAEVDGLGVVTLGVTNAHGSKCERCWTYSTTVGQSERHPTLCSRCEPVVPEDLVYVPIAELEAASA